MRPVGVLKPLFEARDPAGRRLRRVQCLLGRVQSMPSRSRYHV